MSHNLSELLSMKKSLNLLLSKPPLDHWPRHWHSCSEMTSHPLDHWPEHWHRQQHGCFVMTSHIADNIMGWVLFFLLGLPKYLGLLIPHYLHSPLRLKLPNETAYWLASPMTAVNNYESHQKVANSPYGEINANFLNISSNNKFCYAQNNDHQTLSSLNDWDQPPQAIENDGVFCISFVFEILRATLMKMLPPSSTLPRRGRRIIFILAKLVVYTKGIHHGAVNGQDSVLFCPVHPVDKSADLRANNAETQVKNRVVISFLRSFLFPNANSRWKDEKRGQKGSAETHVPRGHVHMMSALEGEEGGIPKADVVGEVAWI